MSRYSSFGHWGLQFPSTIFPYLIHGTHYRKDDLERIKKNNISLVLCPRCNGYFGSGFPPINEVYDLGIPISLGTDNVMANNIDLFEEMKGRITPS